MIYADLRTAKNGQALPRVWGIKINIDADSACSVLGCGRPSPQRVSDVAMADLRHG